MTDIPRPKYDLKKCRYRVCQNPLCKKPLDHLKLRWYKDKEYNLYPGYEVIYTRKYCCKSCAARCINVEAARRRGLRTRWININIKWQTETHTKKLKAARLAIIQEFEKEGIYCPPIVKRRPKPVKDAANDITSFRLKQRALDTIREQAQQEQSAIFADCAL